MLKPFRIFLATLTICIPVFAQEATQTKQFIEKQKAVAGQTERTIRRMETLLSVLQYYQLNQSEETKLIQEATEVLGGLRKEDMAAVIHHLENAAKAKVRQSADGETTEAYKRHQFILEKLRELAARQNAVRSLEMAAERMERASREENKVHTTLGLLISALEGNNPSRVDLQKIALKLLDRQADLNAEVAVLLTQATELEPKLDEERKARLKQGLQISTQEGLRSTLASIQTNMPLTGNNQEKAGRLKPAIDTTLRSHDIMHKVAKAWRGTVPEKNSLREIQEKIAKLARDQKEMVEDSKQNASKRDEETRNEVAQKQADMAAETRDVMKSRESIIAPALQELSKAEKSLKEASKALVNKDDKKTLESQEKAEMALEAALEKINQAVTKEMNKKNDSVAKAMDLVEKIAKMEQQQKQIQDSTKKLEQPEAKPDPKKEEASMKKAESLAKQEMELSEQAKETAKSNDKETPKEVKDALAKAAKSQEMAAEQLKKAEKAAQAAEKSKASMEDARQELKKALDVAQKNLAAKREEAEKLANREKSVEALAKAAEMQKNVAEKISKAEASMDALRQKDFARELYKEQAKATNQATAAAKMAQDSAKKKADDAMADQKTTEKALAKNDLAKAAETAMEAAKKLEQAAKEAAEMARADMQKKALELAMKDNESIQVAEAARRVSQALEKTREAQKQAEKAVGDLTKKSSDPANDLAKKQEDLAKNLEGMKEKGKAAAEPAKEAAEAIKKGDLAKAMEQQKESLEMLEGSSAKSTDGTEKNGLEKAAMQQKELMQATKDLAKSSDAASMAKDATTQAEALVPENLKNDLKAAEAMLEKGAEAAAKGNAEKAALENAKAAEKLEKSLDMLKELAKALDDMPADQKQALAKADLPTNEKNPNKSDPMNKKSQAPPQGNEEKQPEMPPEPDLAKLLKGEGTGAFLKLPEKQREALLQAMTADLPPEYSAMIRKYYRDLAAGKTNLTAPAIPKR